MNKPQFVSTLLLPAIALLFGGCLKTDEPPPKDPRVQVTVAQPVLREIVEWDAYIGRLEPVEFVEIRARVSGYLDSIHFNEGQIVTKGDLLFAIDPRPFEAELLSAKAAQRQSESQLLQAEATLEEATAQEAQSDAQLELAGAMVRRARKLKDQNAISQEELDQTESNLLQAEANAGVSRAGLSAGRAAIASANAAIESAKAGVEIAELNLSYSRIYAPVTGRISRENVNRGNLVSGGSATSTLLTTVASVQPIYCTFDASEQEVLKYIRLAMSGRRESSRVAKNPVFLGLVDEGGFPRKGHMDFVDNRFDANTASMRARCVFPNKDEVLLPGMFARIRIPGSAPYEAVLIPDSAVGTDQSTQFVYVVEDEKIVLRTVQLGPMVDGLRVVREGLDGSESLVIEGLLQSRPGSPTMVTPGTIEVVEDGLPNSYEPLPESEWLGGKPDSVPAPYEVANPNSGAAAPPLKQENAETLEAGKGTPQ